ERMERMLGNVAASVGGQAGAPRLLAGTGSDEVQLLVVMTANRGLCGGFNSSIIKAARTMALELKASGKIVKILCVGKKGRDGLKAEFSKEIVELYDEFGSKGPVYGDAEAVGKRILEMFEAGEFDVCTLIYNKFQSAISQIVTRQQLVPFAPPEAANENEPAAGPTASYEYEPDEEGILKELLPTNVTVQVYGSMLESFASEQGARMTAMDNATRNAGDMIKKLTLTYNRTRQAQITKELIEIISGAEAL
ncbi:MAG: F0F1 ATP synthase subunit gamma, partial [Rhodospirillaceae bacterium]